MFKDSLKISGWSLIAVLAISFLYGIYEYLAIYYQLPPQGSLIVFLCFFAISVPLIFQAFGGFIILGRRNKSKFLTAMGITGIILDILFLMLAALAARGTLEKGEFSAMMSVGSFLPALGVLTIYLILLGISLYELKDDIKLAGTAGILLIIGGVTYIIGIGQLIAFAGYIMCIIVFFKNAKNKKSRNKKNDKKTKSKKRK